LCRASLSRCEKTLAATQGQLEGALEREAAALSNIEAAALREATLTESRDTLQQQLDAERTSNTSLTTALADATRRVDQGCASVDSLRRELKNMTASKSNAAEQARDLKTALGGMKKRVIATKEELTETKKEIKAMELEREGMEAEIADLEAKRAADATAGEEQAAASTDAHDAQMADLRVKACNAFYAIDRRLKLRRVRELFRRWHGVEVVEALRDDVATEAGARADAERERRKHSVTVRSLKSDCGDLTTILGTREEQLVEERRRYERRNMTTSLVSRALAQGQHAALSHAHLKDTQARAAGYVLLWMARRQKRALARRVVLWKEQVRVTAAREAEADKWDEEMEKAATAERGAADGLKSTISELEAGLADAKATQHRHKDTRISQHLARRLTAAATRAFSGWCDEVRGKREARAAAEDRFDARQRSLLRDVLWGWSGHVSPAFALRRGWGTRVSDNMRRRFLSRDALNVLVEWRAAAQEEKTQRVAVARARRKQVRACCGGVFKSWIKMAARQRQAKTRRNDILRRLLVVKTATMKILGWKMFVIEARRVQRLRASEEAEKAKAEAEKKLHEQQELHREQQQEQKKLHEAQQQVQQQERQQQQQQLQEQKKLHEAQQQEQQQERQQQQQQLQEQKQQHEQQQQLQEHQTQQKMEQGQMHEQELSELPPEMPDNVTTAFDALDGELSDSKSLIERLRMELKDLEEERETREEKREKERETWDEEREKPRKVAKTVSQIWKTFSKKDGKKVKKKERRKVNMVAAQEQTDASKHTAELNATIAKMQAAHEKQLAAARVKAAAEERRLLKAAHADELDKVNAGHEAEIEEIRSRPPTREADSEQPAKPVAVDEATGGGDEVVSLAEAVTDAVTEAATGANEVEPATNVPAQSVGITSGDAAVKELIDIELAAAISEMESEHAMAMDALRQEAKTAMEEAKTMGEDGFDEDVNNYDDGDDDGYTDDDSNTNDDAMKENLEIKAANEAEIRRLEEAQRAAEARFEAQQQESEEAYNERLREMQERADAAHGQEQEELTQKLKEMNMAEERRLAKAREVAERYAREEAEALRQMREKNDTMQAKINAQERQMQRIKATSQVRSQARHQTKRVEDDGSDDGGQQSEASVYIDTDTATDTDTDINDKEVAKIDVSKIKGKGGETVKNAMASLFGGAPVGGGGSESESEEVEPDTKNEEPDKKKERTPLRAVATWMVPKAEQEKQKDEYYEEKRKEAEVAMNAEKAAGRKSWKKSRFKLADRTVRTLMQRVTSLEGMLTMLRKELTTQTEERQKMWVMLQEHQKKTKTTGLWGKLKNASKATQAQKDADLAREEGNQAATAALQPVILGLEEEVAEAEATVQEHQETLLMAQEESLVVAAVNETVVRELEETVLMTQEEMDAERGRVRRYERRTMGKSLASGALAQGRHAALAHAHIRELEETVLMTQEETDAERGRLGSLLEEQTRHAQGVGERLATYLRLSTSQEAQIAQLERTVAESQDQTKLQAAEDALDAEREAHKEARKTVGEMNKELFKANLKIKSLTERRDELDAGLKEKTAQCEEEAAVNAARIAELEEGLAAATAQIEDAAALGKATEEKLEAALKDKTEEYAQLEEQSVEERRDFNQLMGRKDDECDTITRACKALEKTQVDLQDTCKGLRKDLDRCREKSRAVVAKATEEAAVWRIKIERHRAIADEQRSLSTLVVSAAQCIDGHLQSDGKRDMWSVLRQSMTNVVRMDGVAAVAAIAATAKHTKQLCFRRPSNVAEGGSKIATKRRPSTAPGTGLRILTNAVPPVVVPSVVGLRSFNRPADEENLAVAALAAGLFEFDAEDVVEEGSTMSDKSVPPSMATGLGKKGDNHAVLAEEKTKSGGGEQKEEGDEGMLHHSNTSYLDYLSSVLEDRLSTYHAVVDAYAEQAKKNVAEHKAEIKLKDGEERSLRMTIAKQGAEVAMGKAEIERLRDLTRQHVANWGRAVGRLNDVGNRVNNVSLAVDKCRELFVGEDKQAIGVVDGEKVALRKKKKKKSAIGECATHGSKHINSTANKTTGDKADASKSAGNDASTRTTQNTMTEPSAVAAAKGLGPAAVDEDTPATHFQRLDLKVDSILKELDAQEAGHVEQTRWLEDTAAQCHDMCRSLVPHYKRFADCARRGLLPASVPRGPDSDVANTTDEQFAQYTMPPYHVSGAHADLQSPVQVLMRLCEELVAQDVKGVTFIHNALGVACEEIKRLGGENHRLRGLVDVVREDLQNRGGELLSCQAALRDLQEEFTKANLHIAQQSETIYNLRDEVVQANDKVQRQDRELKLVHHASHSAKENRRRQEVTIAQQGASLKEAYETQNRLGEQLTTQSKHIKEDLTQQLHSLTEELGAARKKGEQTAAQLTAQTGKIVDLEKLSQQHLAESRVLRQELEGQAVAHEGRKTGEARLLDVHASLVGACGGHSGGSAAQSILDVCKSLAGMQDELVHALEVGGLDGTRMGYPVDSRGGDGGDDDGGDGGGNGNKYDESGGAREDSEGADASSMAQIEGLQRQTAELAQAARAAKGELEKETRRVQMTQARCSELAKKQVEAFACVQETGAKLRKVSGERQAAQELLRELLLVILRPRGGLDGGGGGGSGDGGLGCGKRVLGSNSKTIEGLWGGPLGRSGLGRAGTDRGGGTNGGGGSEMYRSLQGLNINSNTDVVGSTTTGQSVRASLPPARASRALPLGLFDTAGTAGAASEFDSAIVESCEATTLFLQRAVDEAVRLEKRRREQQHRRSKPREITPGIGGGKNKTQKQRPPSSSSSNASGRVKKWGAGLGGPSALVPTMAANTRKRTPSFTETATATASEGASSAPLLPTTSPPPVTFSTRTRDETATATTTDDGAPGNKSGGEHVWKSPNIAFVKKRVRSTKRLPTVGGGGGGGRNRGGFTHPLMSPMAPLIRRPQTTSGGTGIGSSGELLAFRRVSGGGTSLVFGPQIPSLNTPEGKQRGGAGRHTAEVATRLPHAAERRVQTAHASLSRKTAQLQHEREETGGAELEGVAASGLGGWGFGI
jgi:chromosome segregation ATPase